MQGSDRRHKLGLRGSNKHLWAPAGAYLTPAPCGGSNKQQLLVGSVFFYFPGAPGRRGGVCGWVVWMAQKELAGSRNPHGPKCDLIL